MASLEIPATVQSVLAARIDRLAEREKHVLQTASVVGKEIPDSILRRVADLPDADLSAAIATLVAGEFVFEKSLYPDVEYAFKHPLTHQTAYESQLSERRARTHGAVAAAMEAVEDVTAVVVAARPIPTVCARAGSSPSTGSPRSSRVVAGSPSPHWS